MPFCCVPQCKNHKQIVNSKAYFHSFPLKDTLLSKKWAAALKVSPRPNLFVCNEHFTKDDYLPKSSYTPAAPNTDARLLKKGKVPSKNLPKLKVLTVKKETDGLPKHRTSVKNGCVPRIVVNKKDGSTTCQVEGLEQNKATNNTFQPDVKQQGNNSMLQVYSFSAQPSTSQNKETPALESVQEWSSKFEKLFNETSTFFSKVCQRLDETNASVQEHQFDIKNVKKDVSDVVIINETIYNLKQRTAEDSADVVFKTVDKIYEQVLPEESMCCTEENHKGTQTRVVTVNKSVQTDPSGPELKLRKENETLKRKISSLMITVNALQKVQDVSQNKIVYLYRKEN